MKIIIEGSQGLHLGLWADPGHSGETHKYVSRSKLEINAHIPGQTSNP